MSLAIAGVERNIKNVAGYKSKVWNLKGNLKQDSKKPIKTIWSGLRGLGWLGKTFRFLEVLQSR